MVVTELGSVTDFIAQLEKVYGPMYSTELDRVMLLSAVQWLKADLPIYKTLSDILMLFTDSQYEKA